MTTVSRSLVATTRNAGDWLAVGRQVFRSHLVQTSEHLDADFEPNPVDNVQPEMSESPVELARVRDDSCGPSR